ncbi:MAG: hypothetical protein H7Y09_05315 [Chitinophagaceae bacterium]|nr:hypothetical protein [Anaerolineae bacterium]
MSFSTSDVMLTLVGIIPHFALNLVQNIMRRTELSGKYLFHTAFQAMLYFRVYCV